MKKLFRSVLSIAVLATMVACGSAADKSKEVSDEAEGQVEEAMEKTVPIKLDQSAVSWVGSVLGGYSHQGTLAITEGSLDMSGSNIVGGTFTVDMATLTPTDSNYSEGHTAEMLVGHLSTGDFFQVDSFPTATFVVKSADMKAMTITGDLTVKGITKQQTIQDVVVDVTNGSAKGSLTFDRQDYGVSYVSTMKDMVVSNNIELTIHLKM